MRLNHIMINNLVLFQPFYPFIGGHHTQERVGHEALGRDPQREGYDFTRHGADVGRGHGPLGSQGRTGRNVSGKLAFSVIQVQFGR